MDTTEQVKTSCLLVEELLKGHYYRCFLSGGRLVMYLGEGKIKWYNAANDEYREDKVHDYQLTTI